MARIVIIGGGIAGLSAAYDLNRDGRHQVTLIESSDRLGGKILTHHVDGLTIEGGPDSIFTSKPWAVELMTELGLEPEFEEPIGSGFSILVGGKLHVVPRALAGLIPTANTALESVGFLGAAARKRITSEHSIEKGTGHDESIASFFRRRFGSRFSKTLAEPLLAGIHAGDAEKLSMKALYPTYIGLEQKHGSLTGGVTTPPSTGGHGPAHPRRPGFLTLRGGLACIVDALIKQLDDVDVRLNTKVTSILKSDGGYQVATEAENIDASAVILAIPAYASAPFFETLAPAALPLLNKIRHASTAVATLAFHTSAFPHELHGNGFLVPADETADITGCTYSSLKWRERSPANVVLIRAFMGRDGGMNIDDFTDDQLISKAQVLFDKLLKCKEKPFLTRVDRWSHAMPQYDLGHLDLMDEIEAAIGEQPIYLAGTSYRGTGVPDCIRQGREAAAKALANLAKA